MQKNRKKITIYLGLIVLILLIIEPVFALECNGLLTVGAANLLQKIINWIRILVPILLIVLGSIDFGTAVMSEDKDALKKATSRFVKRCIAAIAIFFIPLVVTTLLNLPGVKGNINLVDDPLCGIE